MNRNSWWRSPFLFVAAWTLFIFLSVPYTPKISGALTAWLNETFQTDKGYSWIGHAAAAGLAFTLLTVIWKTQRAAAWRSPWRVLLFLAVCATYGRLIWSITIALEKVHFLEYGFLAYLLHRAWRERCPTSAVWPIVFFSGSLVGTLDESLQAVTPMRHGEFADVCWNVAAVSLPLVVIGIFAPAGRKGGPNDGERRWIRVLGSAFVTILAAFLVLSQEFGFEIADPRGYRFHSRAGGPEVLIGHDDRDAADTEELSRQTSYTYDAFLARHPEKTEPFLNEFRVHLFRRDRYLGEYVHGLHRLSVARPDLETDVAAFPELRAAHRDYAAHYCRDFIVDKICTEPEKNQEFHDKLRSWVRGGQVSWGDALWETYVSIQKRKAKNDPAIMKELLDKLFVAERENAILEDYFARHLRLAGAEWSDGFQDEVALRLVDRAGDDEYESAVAERIFTGVSKREILFFAALALALVLAAPDRLARPGWLGTLAAAAAAYYALSVHPRYVHPDAVPDAALLGRRLPAVVAASSTEIVLSDALGDTSPLSATRCRVTADDHFLHVDFTCEDSDIVSTIRDHDADLWREDAVEIFIDTEGTGRHYAELEIGPSGAAYDALVTFARTIDFAGSKAWTCAGLEARTGRVEGGWTATARVPLAALGVDAERPRYLRVNFCRIDRGSAEPPRFRYQAWSPTHGWFHKPRLFGMVILP